MKTPKRNSGLHLQKRNNRWKWMAGATAATAAGVTTSQGNTITIGLVNNYINWGADQLNADLTGDGHPDIVITNAFYYTSQPSGITHTGYFVGFAGVNLNGIHAQGAWEGTDVIGHATLGSRYVSTYGQGGASLTGSIPIFFKDLHINGGAPTKGSLEVTVQALGGVQLDSFTYNTPGPGSRLGAAVPDQGSSLALLAMGAGGILALRRRRAAQGRS